MNDNKLFQNTSAQMSESEMRKAAYALNLCTVSVSQIVSFDDLMVLEQEYDGILNNLNLHNMPKDEALLDVLKQILDTVTFFRIQEGDKKMLEKAYQHKLKNAIWAAAPNLAVVLGTGNPWTAIGALATQVGIGYMNYRNAKAEALLEKEQQGWQLMRTAIEQFNSLRRVLFNTAWRLAETYNFPDHFRLTENQIDRFNQILLDANPYRRFERLSTIQDYFEAYPPFWYYLGHAANECALKSEEVLDENYAGLAKEAFEEYLELDQMDLLRKNPIYSSCCLEYVDLMFAKYGANVRLIQYVDRAKLHSGDDLDILQICATSYMKLNCLDKAMPLLRKLAIEGFNTKSNAMMLSYLYLQTATKQTFPNRKFEYDGLKQVVNPSYLLPWPTDYLALTKNVVSLSEDDSKSILDSFLAEQSKLLVSKQKYVLRELVQKYNYKWNRFLYEIPGDDRGDDDNLYLDTWRLNPYRRKHLESIYYRKPNVWNEYIKSLCSKNILFTYESILNELILSLAAFMRVESNFILDCILLMYLKSYYQELMQMLKDASNEVSVSDLLQLTTKFSFFEIFQSLSLNKERELSNISELIAEEDHLLNICQTENIKLPSDDCTLTVDNTEAASSKIVSLMDLWDIKYLKEMTDILERNRYRLAYTPSAPKIILYNEAEFIDASKLFMQSESCRNIAGKGGEIIAYLNDGNSTHMFVQLKGVTVMKAKMDSFSQFMDRLKEGISFLESASFVEYEKINYSASEKALRATSITPLNIAKKAFEAYYGGLFDLIKNHEKFMETNIYACEQIDVELLYSCLMSISQIAKKYNLK